MAGAVQPLQHAGSIRRLIHPLLIAPEAPLIVGLLLLDGILYTPWIALLISLLVITFIARIAALYLAALALRHARWNEAETLTIVALALHPWSADALALHGAVMLMQGNAERAIHDLRRAARLAPQRTSILAALSGALLEQERSAEAESAARRALDLEPGQPTAHLHLAQALAANSHPAEAIEEQLRSGLAHQPEPDAEAALHCALARHLAGQGRFAEAALALSSAQALLPRCSGAQRAVLQQRMTELTAGGGTYGWVANYAVRQPL